MNLKKHTIKELHEALKNGSTTSADLLNQAYEEIKNRDGSINAFVEVYDQPEGIVTDSVLSGIPAAMKDNILFKGKKASASSHMLKDYVASYDSKIAEVFAEHNIPVVGRVNMDEFAMGSSTETSAFGKTLNPLDESRVPGGSSGGSAAAVAAGMAKYALGSDTGGSIRQPAAYCGLVGLKPTYGAVSRRGLMALGSSLDVIGPLAHCVEDAQCVFDALAVEDTMDSTCVPVDQRKKYQQKNTNNKVIGVPRSFVQSEGVDPEVLANFNDSLEKMKEQGYTVVDIDLPTLKHALAVYYIIQPAEASSNLARYDGIRYGFSQEGDDLIDGYFKTKTNGFGKEVQRRIMLGTHVLSSGYHDEYYYKAQALRAQMTQEVHNILDTVDVIATPTVPSVAFKFGAKKDPIAMYLEDIFTVPYNLTGNPAIAIPSGIGTEKMPFSIHFTGPMFCEEKLFEIGKDFERAII